MRAPPCFSAEIRPELRCAWLGPSLLAVDPRGRIGSHVRLSGYFFRETRYLSELRFVIHGEEPHLCSIDTSTPDRIEMTHVHPEIRETGGGGTDVATDEERCDEHGIAYRSIEIVSTLTVRPNGLSIRIAIGNRACRVAELEIRTKLDADFADLSELIAARTPPPRAATRFRARDHDVELVHTHPLLRYRTRIRSEGAVFDSRSGELAWKIALAPNERRTIALEIRARDYTEHLDEGEADRRAQALDAWRAQHTGVAVKGTPAIAIARALEDLAALPLLEGDADEWLTPQAAIPFYPALFGRDALTVSWQASFVDGGSMLDASLSRLARAQGTRVSDDDDQEPGRIVQQIRQGPKARLGETPMAAYYGDFASPLMFVIGLVQHFAWTGDRKIAMKHYDAARRIFDWARDYGDRDGDGYLEYLTRSPHGPKNQAWKDSGLAMLDEAGDPIAPPIAACEIQGYLFAAHELFSILEFVLGHREDARAHFRASRELKARFNRDFWIEDEGYFGLALDSEKRLVRTIASNAGHCIASGIIDRDKLPRVVDRLFARDLYSGFGVRTLSSAHPSYHPLSYHTGSVWAVENATIAFGLRRFGFDDRALELADALFDLGGRFVHARIPEAVGGYDRSELSHPGAYPQANAPQAWNASAMPLLVQTMLGLLPLAPLDTLIIDPVLPSSIDEIVLEGLRVAGASVDLRAWRDERGRSHFEVLRKKGTLHIVRQPPPESVSAGVVDRLRSLVDGLIAA